MDIFEAIRTDHGHCREIMDQLEASSPRGKTRERLLTKLADELILHQEAEEAAFYPAVLDEKETRDTALEALEEHRVLSMILQDLEGTACDDERWLSRLTVLREFFEHHAEEEEEELFDEAQDLLDEDQADDLGKEFLRAKKKEEPTRKSGPKRVEDAEEDEDELDEPDEPEEDEEEEREDEDFEDDEMEPEADEEDD